MPISPLETVVEPVASFQYSIEGANAPVTVNFVNTSMNSHAIVWDFGSGEIATSETVKREYKTGGTYEVKLTAIGPGGTNTKVQEIIINDAATTLHITSLTVIKSLMTDPDHDTGGDGDADLYVKILDGSNTVPVLFSSTVFSNLHVFPVSWSPNINFEFGQNPEHQLKIQLLDDDVTSPDDLIDELELIPSDYMSLKSHYPQTITLTSAHSTVMLNVEWK